MGKASGLPWLDALPSFHFSLATSAKEGIVDRTVTVFASDGHSLSAHLAGPERATKVIVAIRGNIPPQSHIREVVERFVAGAYAICAPVLLDRVNRGAGLGYTRDDGVRDLRMRSANSQVMADVEAAAATMNGMKREIVGYCLGGTVAFWVATRSRSFAAASCWRGGGIAGTKDERANGPLQMHFGENDPFIPIRDVDAIRAVQPKAEVYVHNRAGHCFGCDESMRFGKRDYDLAQHRTIHKAFRLRR